MKSNYSGFKKMVINSTGVMFSLYLLLLLPMAGKSQTTVIPSGSFIINMGVSPQTVANGMKPYGMVYDIVKNYHGSVTWAINPSKSKDGTDFAYNGVDYKGGTFIIPANYRTTAINGRITYWTGTMGVIGVTTTAPITLPYTVIELNNMPQWTLDYQNGSIAVNFFNYAGIDPTAYGGSDKSGWKNPAELNCCDDLFVMPHADPEWSTHGHLLDWNLTCKGGIWLGCHAGSALEDMFNPASKTDQTNFLTNKTGTATGSGPYCQNALVLWSNHKGGTPSYSYAYPADPIMQFMGTMDAAQQNGSEQVYIPFAGASWRSGTKVYVWDPSPVNTLGTGIFSSGPAATLASGRGFGSVDRGRVMMEAAHNISGTGTDNVAAMRAFFNFSFYATEEKAQDASLSINPIPPTLYNGTPQVLSYSFSGSGTYSILWQTSCGGTFSPNATSASVTYYPPLVSGPTSCIISVTLTDQLCPLKTYTSNQSVTIGCNLQVTPTITNPCYGSSNGSIAMAISGGTPVFNWNWSRSGGGSGNGTGTSITGLAAGVYNITVVANGGSGCSKTFTATLTEAPAIAITATASAALCNGGATGGISVSVSGGTPAYTYLWTDGPTTQNRSGLVAGTYSLRVTDSKGCTATSSATVSQPGSIAITPSVTGVTCNGTATGAISLSVAGGTAPYTYAWTDGPTIQNRTGLLAGTYAVTVTDAHGCTRTQNGITVGQPTAITASATAGSIGCNGGTTTLSVTAGGGTGSLQYSLNGGTYQSGNTFTVTASPSAYIVTVKDANNCTKTCSTLVTQPAALILSTVLTHVTCPGNTDGAIVLTVSGGTTPYASYAWAGPSGYTASTKDISSLAAGSYTVIVTDHNGCTATTTVTLNTLHNNPATPSGIN